MNDEEEKYIKGSQEWYDHLTSDDMQDDNVYTPENQGGDNANDDNPPTPPTPKEQRQQDRAERKAYRKENGTALGNEAKALGKAIKEGVKSDWDALTGKNRKPAANAEGNANGNANAEETVVTPPADGDENNPPTEKTEVVTPQSGDTDYANATYNKSGVDAFGDVQNNVNEDARGSMQSGAGADATETALTPKDPPTDEENPPTNQTKVKPLSQEEANKIWEEKMAPIRLKNIDDKDLTSEQAVAKYKTKEELAAHNFNEDGTPMTPAPVSGGGENTLPQPPAIPSAEDDEALKGVQSANETRAQAWSDYNKFYEDFLKQQEEYDKERTRRDAANAFWRGIGEVGSSLVNMLGVSGAFGGRNAYGRGNYSSMMNFDLTTGKLTDKMRADMDKRKERMDELKQKQMENKLKWQEIVAKGQEAEGTAKGAANDKEYTRGYTQWKDQLAAQQAADALNERAKEAAATLKYQYDALQTNKDIEKIRANGKGSGRGSGNGGGSGSGSGKSETYMEGQYYGKIPVYETDGNGKVVIDPTTGKPKETGEWRWGRKFLDTDTDTFSKIVEKVGETRFLNIMAQALLDEDGIDDFERYESKYPSYDNAPARMTVEGYVNRLKKEAEDSNTTEDRRTEINDELDRITNDSDYAAEVANNISRHNWAVKAISEYQKNIGTDRHGELGKDRKEALVNWLEKYWHLFPDIGDLIYEETNSSIFSPYQRTELYTPPTTRVSGGIPFTEG